MKFLLSVLCLVIFIVISGVTCAKNENAQVRASVPEQILRCMQKFNLLRCLKYFLLFRLELSKTLDTRKEDFNSKNFFEMILKKSEEMPSVDFPEKFDKYGEDELNEKLTEKVQSYFSNQPITLKFIPDFVVKIGPAKSKTGEIELSLRKLDESDEETGSARSGKSRSSEESSSSSRESGQEKDDDLANKQMGNKKGNYLHVGIPLFIAPVMIFFGILPFLIPVLKFATAFTSIVNFTALIASIFYLGKMKFQWSRGIIMSKFHFDLIFHRSSVFTGKRVAANDLL